MARKTITVEIPDDSPDDMFTLLDRILAKHNEEPATSPIDKEDIAILEAVNKDGAPMRKQAKKLDEQKQALNNEARQLLGMGEGQNRETPGTALFAITGVRDTLLKKFRGKEEKLSEYGFNVVIGQTKGRKTIRVDIPDGSPDDMFTLLDRILDKHKELDKDSPLDPEDVKTMVAVKEEGVKMRAKAKESNDKKQALNNEARQLLGMGKGQNRKTPGTALFAITGVRDTLLKKFRGKEEKLSEYGFNVVIGEARNPVRKPKP